MKNKTKMYVNMLIYTTTTIFLTLVLVGGSLSYVVSKEGLSFAEKNNSNYVEKIAQNILYIYEVSQGYSMSYFNSSLTKSLLTADEPFDGLSLFSIIRDLQASLASSDVAESALLYNGYIDEGYSSTAIDSDYNIEMMYFLQSDQSSWTTETMLRMSDSKKFVSFVVADRNVTTGIIEMAYVMDVPISKFTNHLSGNDDDTYGRFILAQNDGVIITDTVNQQSTGETLENEFLQLCLQNSGGGFYYNFDDQDSIITIEQVGASDWILVNVQPEEQLYAFANTINNQILFIVIIALIVSYPITMFFSNLIYRPINKTIMRVKEKALNNGLDPKSLEKLDEARMLDKIFDKQSDQLSKLEDRQWRLEEAQKRDALRSILLGSSTRTTKQYKNEIASELSDSNLLSVALLFIDSYPVFEDNENSERNILRYAIINITEEYLNELGSAMAVSMSEYEIAIVMSISQGNSFKDVQNSYKVVIDKVAEVLQLSVGVIISNAQSAMPELYKNYQSLKRMSRYSLLYGAGHVLSTDTLQEQDKKQVVYPEDIDGELMISIKQTDEGAAYMALEKLAANIGKGSVDGYMTCLQKLLFNMQIFIKNINQNRISKVVVDFEGLQNAVLKAHNSKVLMRALKNAVSSIIEQLPNTPNIKVNLVVDTVKEFVDANYMDRRLCTKFLGEKFDISAGYLNTLFNMNYSIGVGEYINKVRLDQAQKMVLGTNLKITSIIEKCGFETSSFYRLYKAEFGISPKEQRTKQIVDEGAEV